MLEKFAGAWKCIDSQNFGEYLSALGAPKEIVKAGSSSNPEMVFSCNGDKVDVKIQHGPPTFTDVGVSFKLGQEFDENTSDGRMCKSVVNMDGGKLVYLQKWDGKETQLVREIRDGKLVANLAFGDVKAVRTYEKA